MGMTWTEGKAVGGKKGSQRITVATVLFTYRSSGARAQGPGRQTRPVKEQEEAAEEEEAEDRQADRPPPIYETERHSRKHRKSTHIHTHTQSDDISVTWWGPRPISTWKDVSSRFLAWPIKGERRKPLLTVRPMLLAPLVSWFRDSTLTWRVARSRADEAMTRILVA
jgi:hypothetical protein